MVINPSSCPVVFDGIEHNNEQNTLHPFPRAIYGAQRVSCGSATGVGRALHRQRYSSAGIVRACLGMGRAGQ